MSKNKVNKFWLTGEKQVKRTTEYYKKDKRTKKSKTK